MNLEALRAELAEGVIRPAYLVVGEEPLLRDDALALLRDAVLAGAPEDFNFDRLDGETTPPAALLDAVGSLPVMAARRLVVLREPEAARGRAKALTDAVLEAVTSARDRVDSVLVVVAAKADRRSRWVKAFKEPAAELRCDSPRTAREVAAFVRAEAKRQGVSIERAAVDLLVERVGPQLLLLRGELEKAALLAGAVIERCHVAAGTSDVAEESIWALTDAIGDGRGADALVVLAKLLKSGAAAPQLLGTLAAHFRKLLR
ncbi:MAG: DNA polymerase III subunit delta, partial [Planctomycetota bacterium]